MNEQTYLLNAQGLKKYFPITAGILKKEVGYVKAVDDVDFHIAYKEVLAIVGESSSGKSTTARMIMRLIEPTSGKIEFLGQEVLQLNEQELKEVRKNCQMVFQNPYGSLNPRKTIEKSIGEALTYHHLVSNFAEEESRVVEILKLVGLSESMLYRYPHELSGGQQQRVCIGRAIATNPKLIICDEALSALDLSVQAQILNLLMDLQEQLGLSYLFISHDLSVVRHFADRVAVMHKGKIVETATTEELFENPQNDYTQHLLASIPVANPTERKRKS